MSEIKKHIELIPDFQNPKEKLVSFGHQCPRCHGTGECMVVDNSKDMTHWDTCPFCDGNGEVRALITIEWGTHINK